MRDEHAAGGAAGRRGRGARRSGKGSPRREIAMQRVFTLLAVGTLSLLAACATHDADEYRLIEPSPDYPLTTCIVTGEELGSAGGVAAIEFRGREVQLCCERCLNDFLADPDTYLAKLDVSRN